MICYDIQLLIEYSVKNGLIQPIDETVIRNQYMNIFGLKDWTPCCLDDEELSKITVDEILDRLVNYACQQGIIEDTANSRDLFDTKLMGVVTPLPHEVNDAFQNIYNSVSPEAATDSYFSYNKKVNYVRAGRIAKDLKWKYKSQYGDLDITINRSKPEKDPRDIAKQGSSKSLSYPKCQLCPENAGFSGTISHPARQNLRPVPIKIGGENWQFQYSPYGYYNEHCIVFNEQHVPMKIDREVFGKLFDFLEFLPHYFIGSNADLPIVGGSILSHEHFQGGRYVFPMETAAVEYRFLLSQFPNVEFGTVKWPMSVIRLRSIDRTQLSQACDYILTKWRSYTDADVGIYAQTDGTPHNTITPIARLKGDWYECDLVLRNNITTEDRPLGVFHPNPSLHHIKKENIGLIEVMGLAVLPSRLAAELKAVENALLEGKDLNLDPATSSHTAWAEEILKAHPDFNSDNAEEIIHYEVGRVFEQVLCDSGVFKRNQKGQNAFKRFIDASLKCV